MTTRTKQPGLMYRTTQLIPGATILLVDMEMQYFTPVYENMSLVDDEYWHDAYLDLMARAGRIFRSLEDAKHKGHRIVATHNYELVHGFDDLVDEHLPPWDQFPFKANERDHDSFYVNLAMPFLDTDVVMVCGVWLERCVYQLTYQLRHSGINAVILDNRAFSMEVKLIGDLSSIEQRAKNEGATLLDYDRITSDLYGRS